MTVPVVNQPTVVTGDNPHYLANCLVFHQTQSSLTVYLGARIDACISYISSQIYFGGSHEMSINNINNSGDGNIFNQNIGGKSIYDLFDIDDLAYEWCHRKNVVTKTRKSRVKSSILKIVLGLVLLGVCLFVAFSEGAVDSIPAFFSFLGELSKEAIITILTFIVGAFATLVGSSDACHRSDAEKRNRETMDLIARRVIDLNFSTRQWKNAKKRAENLWYKNV